VLHPRLSVGPLVSVLNRTHHAAALMGRSLKHLVMR